jgi:O-antigen/teichoic acid export membrane protein
MFTGMVFLSFIIYFLGYKFGKIFIIKIYGPIFTEAASLTILLLIAIFFILPNYMVTQATVALNKEKIYAIIAITSAGINILCNYFLIPIYGAKGAAYATIATEAVLLLLLAAVYWIELQKGFIKKKNKHVDNLTL